MNMNAKSVSCQHDEASSEEDPLTAQEHRPMTSRALHARAAQRIKDAPLTDLHLESLNWSICTVKHAQHSEGHNTAKIPLTLSVSTPVQSIQRPASGKHNSYKHIRPADHLSAAATAARSSQPRERICLNNVMTGLLTFNHKGPAS